MMSLILSNGVVLPILLIILPADQCEIEAKRINADVYYAEMWAYCVPIKGKV